mgnify:CR=1 FL=1|tara:strand:+ start:1502 stop:2194 length:693 start_codon:yes stop_codon:yes gene_type:complete
MDEIKKIKKLLRAGAKNELIILPEKYNEQIEDLCGEEYMKRRVGGGENFLIKNNIMDPIKSDKSGVVDGYGFHNTPIQVKCNSKKKDSMSFPLKNIYPVTDIPLIKELFDVLYRQGSFDRCRDIEKLSTTITKKTLNVLNELAMRHLKTNKFGCELIEYIYRQFRSTYGGIDIMCFQFNEKIGKYELYINPALAYSNATRGNFKFDIDINQTYSISDIIRVEHRPTMMMF